MRKRSSLRPQTTITPSVDGGVSHLGSTIGMTMRSGAAGGATGATFAPAAVPQSRKIAVSGSTKRMAHLRNEKDAAGLPLPQRDWQEMPG